MSKEVRKVSYAVCSLAFCALSAIAVESPRAWKLVEPTPHPRLFVSGEADFAAAKDRLLNSSAGKVGLATLIGKADKFLDSPELKRKKIGKRLLKVSREALDRIASLSLAWKFTGDDKYAAKAVRDARAVCGFFDWNQSHFLDTAEMTLAVAIARDWLDGFLSDSDKNLLSEAILHKGLTKNDGKTASKGAWVSVDNNWNMVCNGGLAAGAAVVRDRYPKIAETILFQARRGLPAGMKALADGNFPEGPGYWMYALEYASVAIEVLEREFEGGVPELIATDGFREQVDYMNHITGPTGLLYNYSDPYVRPAVKRKPSAACYYLARRFGRTDSLALFELPMMMKGDSMGRMHAFGLLWFSDGKGSAESKLPLCRTFAGSNPIAVMRNGIAKNSWYLGIKGGMPSACHGHMDAGSFVLDAEGVRWAYDLGCEAYNTIEQTRSVSLWNRSQDSSRWSLFRLGTQGHGTLVVGNSQQNVNGNAKFVSFSLGPVAETVMDMTSIYPDCKKILRKFSFDMKGGCTISDSLSGVKEGTVVEWNMNTVAKATAKGNELLLEAKNAAGEKLCMKLVASPEDVSWDVFSLEKPPHPLDTPNPGFRRVRFKRIVKENGTLEFSVAFSCRKIAK